MRYRALDANGDYTFGRGAAGFLADSSSCVAQAVLTALRLVQGEWFLDTTAGVPYNTQVLGYNTQAVYDTVIKSAVRAVQGVTDVQNYSSQLNNATRGLQVSMTVITQFGAVQVHSQVAPGAFLPGGYGIGGYGLRGYGV